MSSQTYTHTIIQTYPHTNTRNSQSYKHIHIQIHREDNKLPKTSAASGPFTLYSFLPAKIRIYVGDFFQFDHSLQGKNTVCVSVCIIVCACVHVRVYQVDHSLQGENTVCVSVHIIVCACVHVRVYQVDHSLQGKNTVCVSVCILVCARVCMCVYTRLITVGKVRTPCNPFICW
jgi:hypothetical protein